MAKFTVDAKYLSHADISEHDDTVLTIKSYEQETMGQGKDAQEKWVIYFREIKKGLGLNKTNGKMICKLLGSDDMDHWIGKQVALYVKDDVEFQGEIMSAIRVRAKLPGAALEEDMSTLTFVDVIYRIDHAVSAKEVTALLLHGMSLPLTSVETTALVEAKNSRVAALAGK